MTVDMQCPQCGRQVGKLASLFIDYPERELETLVLCLKCIKSVEIVLEEIKA